MVGPIAETQWRPIDGIDQVQSKDARLQAHHALQWLARTARAYIPPQLDDSHTCLHWDESQDAFVTQTFAGGTRVFLSIPTLTLVVQGDEGAGGPQSFALDGQTDAHVRQWLGKQFEVAGLDRTALDIPAPYEIPMHAIGQGRAYEAHAAVDALTELAAWYANAAALIEAIRRQITGQLLAVSTLCCWPHHFDLAILAMVPAGRAAEPGLIGVGMSPGDEYYDEPYFYVSVYPEPEPAALPPLPVIGQWHIRDFTAAVATSPMILAAKDPPIQVGEFLCTAVAASLALISQAPMG